MPLQKEYYAILNSEVSILILKNILSKDISAETLIRKKFTIYNLQFAGFTEITLNMVSSGPKTLKV